MGSASVEKFPGSKISKIRTFLKIQGGRCSSAKKLAVPTLFKESIIFLYRLKNKIWQKI